MLEAATTGVAAAPTPAAGLASPVRDPAVVSAGAKNLPLNKKIQYLQEQLGAKDKKVAALRLAIVNLKVIHVHSHKILSFAHLNM